MLANLDVYISALKSDPLGFIGFLLTMILVVLISLILHECAHGYIAYRCGDPTAKMLGRLSLNPLRHLDPIGTLSMFLLGFGWAKPVPVNPRNFRDYRRDDFFVSIAGIVTNLTLFIICSFLSVLLTRVLWEPNMFTMMEGFFGSAEGLVNVFGTDEASGFALSIAYGISYDEMELYLRTPWLAYIQRFLLLMANVNLGLAIFNFLPLPPLDGFHILNDTILKGKLQLNPQVFQICQVALFVIVFATDILSNVLNAGCELIGSAVIRTFMMIFGMM